ncbi:hypothetical protein P3342_010206 [Pyrenophora teres f. teres]|uniref:Uncharacterized protein n=2 Tax=Pyrenophora teres f. teres TaxID=97479 RepID=E3S6T8_PYRTT|nr:hypothetical protein PTT_18487 [Pyrenophora teres f. teres 0-1]KAE8828576.1 hypothetical protein PTNB85_07764 [Pyrenophora teres f. teres]KAE8841923.1 hypothetical protein HRS9122_06049 [Pyrenophora teres f. teres]KAE8860027.1 hypothetical protein PTNB29_07258 [Pyrenophora teres f. teres]KAE8865404.1 hypothetical protein PTNB73_06292 [Pyrenophora teres f. teres]
MSQLSLAFSDFIDDEGDGVSGVEKSGGDVDETISVDSQCAIDHGKITIDHPMEGDERVADPVKVTHILPEKEHRSASLPDGIDLDNLISPQNPQLTLTPPESNITTSSHNLRHRTQSKLVYDVKYHPMDDSIRPSQAAKRRSVHGEGRVFDSDDSNEACSFDVSADESSDEHSEVEGRPPKKAAKGKKQVQVQTRLTPREGTRRSARKVSEPKTSYNMDVHPQDKFLVISSDDDEEHASTKKRRKLAHAPLKVDSDLDGGVTGFNTGEEQVQYINSDKSESDREPALASSGGNQDQDTAGDASSLASSGNPSQGSGIRRRESMHVWHLPPGKRYFRHDHNAWPVVPGKPFKIFYEKLEDQLAREALAASPLQYEHDDKENDANIADPDPEPDNHEGISIIPASQYRQSSEDRELSRHRAQMNHALYNDELPLSYGLDGTHATHQEDNDTFSEAMCVLASGGHLPREQPQAESQDSVLGLDMESCTADADSVMGSSFSCSG